MKRLYSYSSLYGVVFGAPVFSLAVIVLACIFAIDEIGIACVPVVPVMLYWLFTFRQWKKVYYENGSLHIYSLFSKHSTMVHKTDNGGINKYPGFYKIIYYDENKDANSVYFQRNWLLDGFSDIIDKLNE